MLHYKLHKLFSKFFHRENTINERKLEMTPLSGGREVPKGSDGQGMKARSWKKFESRLQHWYIEHPWREEYPNKLCGLHAIW